MSTASDADCDYNGDVAIVLAALAAFVNAITSVLQRIGVESAPASSTLRPSLISHALRQGIWLAGFALMLVQFGLQATALRAGQLSTVQPVLTTELLFLLLVLAVWFRYRLGLREWLGALAIVVGLGGFFLAARPHGGQALPSPAGWTVATAVVVVMVGACILGALRGPRWWRAAAFGAATALTAAFGAALTKAITSYLKDGWGAVFSHYPIYMLGVTGLGTVFLLQNALHAGPITASRTTLVTVNPLTSIVLGITLFHDVLRTGLGWTSLEILSLAILILGVVVLTRSPLVAGTGDTDGEQLGGARMRAMEAAPPIEALP